MGPSRRVLLFFKRHGGRGDAPVVRAIWDFKHMLNQENQIQLEQIIAEHGWPKRSKVGKWGPRQPF